MQLFSQKNCMKCKILFSKKIMNNAINLLSAEYVQYKGLNING